MQFSQEYVPVSGSEREPLSGSRSIGPIQPDRSFEISVLLRRRPTEDEGAAYESYAGPDVSARRYLSREELADRHGAASEDAALVEEFARQHNLEVVRTDLPRRAVVLAGPARELNTAFGVELTQYEHPNHTYCTYSGPIRVPREMADVVVGVLGLDDRPQAEPHFKLLDRDKRIVLQQAEGIAYTPIQVTQLYDFPQQANGSGQTVAIIELGGGYTPDDLDQYFSNMGLSTPEVVSVGVDGATNQPTGDPNGPDGEVMLDIEIAGAAANGARIAVYFAPNTDRGFIDAVTTAVNDNTNTPSVISISWGAPESAWTSQSLQALDQAFQDAAMVGVNVCCASGDRGSGDGVSDGQPHVDFPASSPSVLGCGGTRLTVSYTGGASEVVWNNDSASSATGGGVSDMFPLPDWQANAGVPPSSGSGGNSGRGVPDIAANADPQTGYQCRVDGEDVVIGGTSAVAPLWAALIARLNQALGMPVGFANPILYQLGDQSGAFHDIVQGNNGAYSADSGWDACTGLGSPDGTALLNALGGPQSPTPTM